MEKATEKELLVKLGDRLRELRLQKGYTLEGLAYEADIELSQVHRVERGKTNARYTTLVLLSKALGVTVSDLLSGL